MKRTIAKVSNLATARKGENEKKLRWTIEAAGEVAQQIATLKKEYEQRRAEIMVLMGECEIPIGERVGANQYAGVLTLRSETRIVPEKVLALVGLDIVLEIATITQTAAKMVLTGDQLATVVEKNPATKPTLIIERQKDIGGIRPS